MAWPTANDVLRTLPINAFEDSGGKLSAPDVEGYIEGWKNRLGPDDPVETETGRDVVLRGARADSLEQLATASGYADTRAAEGIRREAYRLLGLYRNEIDEPLGEDDYSPGGEEYVENFTDEPLWVGGEYRSRRREEWMYG